jgi:hypothetical protein
MKQILIDKFVLPLSSKNEFIDRMNINRSFIKKLEGFIEDNAYMRIDEKGNLVCITIAVWQSDEALKTAKEIVQGEYKKQGFDLAAMLQRLNITIERASYFEM